MTDPKTLAERLRAANYGDVRDIDAMGLHFALLAEAADALEALSVQPHAEAVAWVVQLKYGEGHWSGEMLTDILPSDTSTYRVLRPLYATPPAAQPQEGDQTNAPSLESK